MSQVDQFESVFRSAIRPAYEPHRIHIDSVMLVTDRAEEESQELEQALYSWMPDLATSPGSQRRSRLIQGDYRSTAELLERIQSQAPDLICTYRNLNTDDWQFGHSLGSRLETIIHEGRIPILIIPHPRSKQGTNLSDHGPRTVLAMTDHLTEDHRLIDFAAAFTGEAGQLILTHLEDQSTFDRYLAAIARIETIDTASAEMALKAELLKSPRAYIATCRERLSSSGHPIDVQDVVSFSNGLESFHEQVAQHQADLVIINGLDHERPGIHGIAQPLVNKIRQVPVLIL